MKTNPFLLCVLVFVVIALRFPSVLEPLDNDSGAIAYHARLILRGEPLYGTHHTGHHMPGVYYTYVLSFLFFGDHAASPKWLLIPWTALSALILFEIGKKLSTPLAGFLAAIFYAILSSHMLLKGMTAEAELFANLPIIAAVKIALDLSEKKEHIRSWFWVGALSAIAILYKAVYLAPIGVACVVISAMALQDTDLSTRWKTTQKRIYWFLFGLVLIFGGVLFYFSSHGLLERFLLIFTFGLRYVKEITEIISVEIPLYVFFPLIFLGVNNVVLVIIALGGVVGQCRTVWNKSGTKQIMAISVVVWWLLSLLQAGVSQIGFAHYVLVVVPVFSLLAGMEISRLESYISEQRSKTEGKVLLITLVLAIMANSFLINGAVYRDYANYLLGKISYTDYLVSHLGTGKIHIKIMQVVDYLEARTDSDDPIYFWGNAVQLYYLADRRCAKDVIWPYYLDAFGPVFDIFGPQTPYIVVEHSDLYSPPPYVEEYFAQGYILESRSTDYEIYRYIGE